MHRAATVLHSVAHLNEYWFTLRIITEEFVTIGNGMRHTGKILPYLSRLSYLDTRNNQLIELIRQCCVHRYQILHTAGLGTNFLLLVKEPNGFPIE